MPPCASDGSRVGRVAKALGHPPEDLRNAMRKHAWLRSGPDMGRVATLSVRVNGARTFRYGHSTAMDRVAQAMGVTSDELRAVMREVAAAEGRESGVWTMSVRVW